MYICANLKSAKTTIGETSGSKVPAFQQVCMDLDPALQAPSGLCTLKHAQAQCKAIPS